MYFIMMPKMARDTCLDSTLGIELEKNLRFYQSQGYPQQLKIRQFIKMGNDIALPNVRRSLHFRIENYEGTTFQSLSPKNQDVLVVKRKLQDLGFDPTELFKDSTHPVNFYERITSELDKMLTLSKGAAQGIINPYQVNFIQIQAHGVMLGQDTLTAVPSSGGGMKYINMQNIAQSFAEVPNSFNIFLIESPIHQWLEQ